MHTWWWIWGEPFEGNLRSAACYIRAHPLSFFILLIMITFLFARLARAVSKKRPGEKSLWGWWWPPYARIGGPELRRFLAA